MRWVVALLLAPVVACSTPAVPDPTSEKRARQEMALPEAMTGLDPTRWVSIYDPDRAWRGYTLAFYRRLPVC